MYNTRRCTLLDVYTHLDAVNSCEHAYVPALVFYVVDTAYVCFREKETRYNGRYGAGV